MFIKMKNKRSIYLLLGIMLIAFISLFLYRCYYNLVISQEALNSEYQFTDNGFIKPTMSIKDVNNKRAVVIITDKNRKKNIFGNSFRLEKYIDGKWEALKETDDTRIICGEWAHTLMGYTVGEDNTLEMTYTWGTSCGSIESGKYRICTSHAGLEPESFVCAEFEIE